MKSCSTRIFHMDLVHMDFLVSNYTRHRDFLKTRFYSSTVHCFQLHNNLHLHHKVPVDTMFLLILNAIIQKPTVKCLVRIYLYLSLNTHHRKTCTDFRSTVLDRNTTVACLDRTLHFVHTDLAHKGSFSLHIHVLCLDFQYSRANMYIWKIRYSTMCIGY